MRKTTSAKSNAAVPQVRLLPAKRRPFVFIDIPGSFVDFWNAAAKLSL